MATAGECAAKRAVQVGASYSLVFRSSAMAGLLRFGAGEKKKMMRLI